MKQHLIRLGQRFLSKQTRRSLVRLTRWPPVGLVRFGSLRRLTPISTTWGTERGQPIDRYYIERFLETQKEDIRGQVLEIGTNMYTLQYGGARVTKSEVLHVAEHRDVVTIIGDLTSAEHIPSDTFDCILLTQTLQVIYDVPAAIRTVYRILKPGGVVLVTVSGLVSKVSRYDMDRWGHHWGFTTRSLQRLFEAAFPSEVVEVEAVGNVLSAIAFLQGLSSGELKKKELDYHDPDFQLLLTLRAVKPATT